MASAVEHDGGCTVSKKEFKKQERARHKKTLTRNQARGGREGRRLCKATTVLFQSEQDKTEVGKGVRKRQRTSQPSQYSSRTASSAGSCEEDSGGCSNNTPIFCRIKHSSSCDEMCNPESKNTKCGRDRTVRGRVWCSRRTASFFGEPCSPRT